MGIGSGTALANPWDNDPDVGAAPSAAAMPWDKDPDVTPQNAIAKPKPAPSLQTADVSGVPSYMLKKPDVSDLQVSQSDIARDQGKWAKRADGSQKGQGWLGVMKRPDGGVSSEISVGLNMDGREVEMPVIVPSLSRDEVNHVLSLDPQSPQFWQQLPQGIKSKVIQHAQERQRMGQSPFRGPDEAISQASPAPPSPRDLTRSVISGQQRTAPATEVALPNGQVQSLKDFAPEQQNWFTKAPDTLTPEQIQAEQYAYQPDTPDSGQEYKWGRDVSLGLAGAPVEVVNAAKDVGQDVLNTPGAIYNGLSKGSNDWLGTKFLRAPEVQIPDIPNYVPDTATGAVIRAAAPMAAFVATDGLAGKTAVQRALNLGAAGALTTPGDAGQRLGGAAGFAAFEAPGVIKQGVDAVRGTARLKPWSLRDIPGPPVTAPNVAAAPDPVGPPVAPPAPVGPPSVPATNAAAAAPPPGRLPPPPPPGAINPGNPPAGPPSAGVVPFSKDAAPKSTFSIGKDRIIGGAVGAGLGGFYDVINQNADAAEGDGHHSTGPNGLEPLEGAAIGAFAPRMLKRGVGRLSQGLNEALLLKMGGQSAVDAYQEGIAAKEVRNLMKPIGGEAAIVPEGTARYGDKPWNLADLSQEAIGTMSGLSRLPGKAGELTHARNADLMEGRGGRIEGDVGAVTGMNPSAVSGDVEGMMGEAQKEANPAYEALRTNHQTINDPRLNDLTEKVPILNKAASEVSSYRDNLRTTTGKEISDFDYWDLVKRNLDAKENKLLSKPGARSSDIDVQDIDNARTALVSKMDELTGGQYAKARELGGEAPKMRAAFAEGQGYLGGRYKTADDVVKAIGEWTGEPLTAARAGVIRSIVAKTEGSGAAIAALRSRGAQKRLAAIFGDENAAALQKRFAADAAIISNSVPQVAGIGSQTSRALMGGGGLGGAIGTAVDLVKHPGSAPGIVLNMLKDAGNSKGVRNKIAEMLTEGATPENLARIYGRRGRPPEMPGAAGPPPTTPAGHPIGPPPSRPGPSAPPPSPPSSGIGQNTLRAQIGAQAADMRSRGWTDEQIGSALGVQPGEVDGHIQAAGFAPNTLRPANPTNGLNPNPAASPLSPPTPAGKGPPPKQNGPKLESAPEIGGALIGGGLAGVQTDENGVSIDPMRALVGGGVGAVVGHGLGRLAKRTEGIRPPPSSLDRLAGPSASMSDDVLRNQFGMHPNEIEDLRAYPSAPSYLQEQQEMARQYHAGEIGDKAGANARIMAQGLKNRIEIGQEASAMRAQGMPDRQIASKLGLEDAYAVDHFIGIADANPSALQDVRPPTAKPDTMGFGLPRNRGAGPPTKKGPPPPRRK